jgi:hypothetical protein
LRGYSHICAVNKHPTFLLQLHIFIPLQRRKPPILGNDDLLTTWELVHGAAESLDGGGTVGVSSADREENLANVDTSDRSVWLSPCTSHSCLQSIGTSARQHLVDSDDVERVGANSKMETFFSCDLDKVLVGANAGSLKSLRAQLFVLIGNHVNAERKLVDICALAAEIEDSNLGVGYTTVEARLRVWLFRVSCSSLRNLRLNEDRISRRRRTDLVLAVAVASRWSSGHLECCFVVVALLANWFVDDVEDEVDRRGNGAWAKIAWQDWKSICQTGNGSATK